MTTASTISFIPTKVNWASIWFLFQKTVEKYLEQLKSSASRKLFCTHLCLAPHRAQLVFNSSLFFLAFVPCGRVFSFTRWYLPRAKLQNCILVVPTFELCPALFLTQLFDFQSIWFSVGLTTSRSWFFLISKKRCARYKKCNRARAKKMRVDISPLSRIIRATHFSYSFSCSTSSSPCSKRCSFSSKFLFCCWHLKGEVKTLVFACATFIEILSTTEQFVREISHCGQKKKTSRANKSRWLSTTHEVYKMFFMFKCFLFILLVQEGLPAHSPPRSNFISQDKRKKNHNW